MVNEELKVNRRYPLISVIIPVYNMEKYLPECLDSIIRQTYSNLDIILIDDGSKDSSGEICDRFAAEDGRIQVVHKENQGRSKARNDGLGLLRGEYYTFVDADDILPQDAVKTLYNALPENGGVVSGRLASFSGSQYETIETETGEVREIAQEAFLESFALDNMHGIPTHCVMDNGAVARLYPRELCDVMFPEDLSYAEDYLYSLTILLKQWKISYVDKVVYRYRRLNEGEKHFWEAFKNLSLEGVEARKRAMKLVKENMPGIYGDYLLRSYYWILDSYCSCIKLGYRDSADKIASELDRIKDDVKRSGSYRKLSGFSRIKLQISFISYRLYAILYLFIRKKEL